MFNFLLDAGNYASRVVGRWDNEAGDRMVSTAEVSDGAKPYETAFMHPDYREAGKMVIVEAYGTRQEAEAGHARWVSVMTDGPLPSVLIDCCNAEIAQFGEAVCGDDFKTFPRKVRSPLAFGMPSGGAQ